MIILSRQRQQLQQQRRRRSSQQQSLLQSKRQVPRGQNGLSWWSNKKRRLSLPLLHLSSSTGGDNDESNNNNNNNEQQQQRQQQGEMNDNRITEFSGLDDIPMVFDSKTRDARKEREEESRMRFVKWGNELWNLRKNMNKLAMKLAKEETKRKRKVMNANDLSSSLAGENTRRTNRKIALLKTQLRILEGQDPVLAYKQSMEQYFHQSRVDEENANKQGGIFLTGTTENQDDYEDDHDDSSSSAGTSNSNSVDNDDNDIGIVTAQDYHERAMAARSCLPYFNLEGLWVGRYGDHGYEMINITYIGDLLLAYKVTGEGNVPKNELSFQVDLNPCSMEGSNIFSGGPKKTKLGAPSETPLQPIHLTKDAAEKWGTEQLQRYRGLGQVAEPGFQNNQWMDGQLIIINEDHFSFAWVPLEQQIFFGRPSPSLALRLMREVQEKNEKEKKNGVDDNNPNDTELILTYDGDDDDDDEDDTDSVTSLSWGENTPPSIDEDIDVLKAFVSSCLEKTDQTVKEDLHGDAFSCIWHGMDAEECFFE